VSTKQEAINQVITLMRTHSIEIAEIKSELQADSESKYSSRFKSFFAFIGAIFILSGLCIYIGEHWNEMNSSARIIITLGSGISLFIFAICVSSNAKNEKVITPLFMLAAVFETVGMFVAIHELFPNVIDFHYPSLVVFGTMYIQQLIVFSKMQRTSLLFAVVVLGCAFIVTALDLMHIKDSHIAVLVGISLMGISCYLNETKHHTITPFWYLLGSISFLYGAFEILENTTFEFLYILISSAIIYLSTVVQSRQLVFSGTVAMIAYICYYTSKHFINSLGWPLALIILGFLLICISMLAVKIGKTIK